MTKLSGGGITSNKNVKTPVKAGSPRTDVVSPGAVSRMGAHAVLTKPQPLVPRTAPDGRMGNDIAATAGCGVGVGRTVHRSGSQSPTPPAQPMPDSQGWPGLFPAPSKAKEV